MKNYISTDIINREMLKDLGFSTLTEYDLNGGKGLRHYLVGRNFVYRLVENEEGFSHDSVKLKTFEDLWQSIFSDTGKSPFASITSRPGYK